MSHWSAVKQPGEWEPTYPQVESLLKAVGCFYYQGGKYGIRVNGEFKCWVNAEGSYAILDTKSSDSGFVKLLRPLWPAMHDVCLCQDHACVEKADSLKQWKQACLANAQRTLPPLLDQCPGYKATRGRDLCELHLPSSHHHNTRTGGGTRRQLLPNSPSRHEDSGGVKGSSQDTHPFVLLVGLAAMVYVVCVLIRIAEPPSVSKW